ncbi:hypothetical protein SSCG_01946 [Streptomyces clavuligerus]|nr:hypothetical protein SSCG_01946 [Streptomyces clavuligerus]
MLSQSSSCWLPQPWCPDGRIGSGHGSRTRQIDAPYMQTGGRYRSPPAVALPLACHVTRTHGRLPLLAGRTGDGQESDRRCRIRRPAVPPSCRFAVPPFRRSAVPPSRIARHVKLSPLNARAVRRPRSIRRKTRAAVVVPEGVHRVPIDVFFPGRRPQPINGQAAVELLGTGEPVWGSRDRQTLSLFELLKW